MQEKVFKERPRINGTSVSQEAEKEKITGWKNLRDKMRWILLSKGGR